MPKEDGEQISHLLDGRLSAESARLMRSRIDEDPELYARYQALKSAREMVRADAGITQLPQGFDSRLRRRLQSEDLKHRAENRARTQAPRGVIWRRAALALTGVAAGVAIALAVGPMIGLQILPAAPENNSTAERNIEALPSRSIGVEYLEPIVNKHLASAREIERLVSGVGQTLDPNWLEAEMRLGGLYEDTKRLEDALNGAFGARARQLESDLRLLRQTVETLRALTQQSLRRGEILSAEQILQVLAELRTPTSGELLVRPELAAPPSTMDRELEAYLLARRLFEQEQFESARQFFDDFRHDWPDSGYQRLAVLFMARSQMRSGRGREAVDLLDAATQEDAVLLSMVSKEDLETLANACGIADESYVVAGGISRVDEGTPSISGMDFAKPESLSYWLLKNRWQHAQIKPSDSSR